MSQQVYKGPVASMTAPPADELRKAQALVLAREGVQVTGTGAVSGTLSGEQLRQLQPHILKEGLTIG